jgi:hypothetical protein
MEAAEKRQDPLLIIIIFLSFCCSKEADIKEAATEEVFLT